MSQLGATPVGLSHVMFKVPRLGGASIVHISNIKEIRIKEVKINEALSQETSLVGGQPWSHAEVVRHQSQDAQVAAVKGFLLGEAYDPACLAKLPINQFILIGSLVYHDDVLEGRRSTVHQLYVPESLVEEALRFAHGDMACHGGVAKSLYWARKYFFWPALYRDMVLHVKACLNCIKTKPEVRWASGMGNCSYHTASWTV